MRLLVSKSVSHRCVGGHKSDDPLVDSLRYFSVNNIKCCKHDGSAPLILMDFYFVRPSRP
jgi:hypothetical protein